MIGKQYNEPSIWTMQKFALPRYLSGQTAGGLPYFLTDKFQHWACLLLHHKSSITIRVLLTPLRMIQNIKSSNQIA
ncbi:MAG: hypothetical protein DYG95_23375 [Chlorobi bacterium CHB1]|nr:hypothetical protein [Chlorobi bacterium CHB1]